MPQAFDPNVGYPAGTLKWLAAESTEQYKHGQEVSMGAALSKGAKLAQAMPGGYVLFVECVDGADFHDLMQKPARGDCRILDVGLNALGHPGRSVREIASMCKEVPVKWVLPGPRTAKWCVNYLSVEGLGFEGHHERLRQVAKVDASSWGIQEHFQLTMSLRQALLVDQLDAFNLLSVEIQFRRLQTIEYSYSEKARDMESKAVGGRLSLEEQTTFGGITRQVCNADDLPRSFRPCQKRSGEGSFFGKEHQEGARGAGSGPQGWQEGREGKPLRSRVRGSAGHGCPAEPSRSSDDRRCPRDIFPIPPTHVSEFVYGCKSRKTQQRRGRRRFFEAEVNRTIDSLNQMYGRPGLQHCGGLDLENYGNLSI